jgi:hypothetical protein
VYNILGSNKDGRKEILGMYTAQSEGANFWLGVISDMKQRAGKISQEDARARICLRKVEDATASEPYRLFARP